MGKLLLRARAEMRGDPTLDSELGPGGDSAQGGVLVQSLLLISGRARAARKGARDAGRAAPPARRGVRYGSREPPARGGVFQMRRAEHAAQIATGSRRTCCRAPPRTRGGLRGRSGFADESELRAESAAPGRDRQALSRDHPGRGAGAVALYEALSASLSEENSTPSSAGFFEGRGRASSLDSAEDTKDTARDALNSRATPTRRWGEEPRGLPEPGESLLSAVIHVVDPALAGEVPAHVLRARAAGQRV